jgi:hypothetical protein
LLVSVYYDHAVRLARIDEADFEVPIILGCAIAHEIGHLLLGPHGHSSAGIMLGQWEPKQIRHATMGYLLFTSQQAKLMRAEARRRMGLQTARFREQRAVMVDH